MLLPEALRHLVVGLALAAFVATQAALFASALRAPRASGDAVSPRRLSRGADLAMLGASAALTALLLVLCAIAVLRAT